MEDQNFEIESDDFFIDAIKVNKTNCNKRHPHARVDEILYRIQCTGFNPDADSWEPLANLTLEHVVDYHEQNWPVMPKALDATIDDRPIRADKSAKRNRRQSEKARDRPHC